MTKLATRAAVLGFDCCIPDRLKAMVDRGLLPNFTKLIKEGSFISDGFNLPTVTPPSWATIATGAYPRTHGIEDFYYYEGGSLEYKALGQSFGSHKVKAEFIWDRWDKEGLKCLVVNYPTSWPSKMKHGVMVGGAGLTIGEDRIKPSGYEHCEHLCSETLISNEIFPIGLRGEIKDAKDWKNIPDDIESPLEMTFTHIFKYSFEPIVEQTWHLLMWESGNKGYDTVLIAPEKDFSKAFCTLKEKEWSSVVGHVFEEKNSGIKRTGYFAFKLLELDSDGDSVRVYMSGINGADGIVSDESQAAKIDFSQVIAARSMGYMMYNFKGIDMETVKELGTHYVTYLSNVVRSLIKENPDWNLLYLHTHLMDWFYHMFMTDLNSKDPEVQRQAAKLEEYFYGEEDRMLGEIWESMGHDTLICAVSDHGATPLGPIFKTHDALAAAGLCDFQTIQVEKKGVEDMCRSEEGWDYVMNIENSKAVPNRYMFVYVNLKSKFPHGCVEDEDYETVQQQIIDALLDYKHPETGERPVVFAMRSRDAQVMGMGGEEQGADVIYALKPEYMAEHGYGLPTAKSGCGALHNMIIFNGPNVKKNYEYKRPRWLVDVVPTVCYLTGNPVPADTEGAPIYQIMVNDNLVNKK